MDTSPKSRPDQERCIVCHSAWRAGLVPWLRRCPACGLECSLLDDAAFHDPQPLGWTEEAETALALLRQANAGRTLDTVAAILPLDGHRILDVGCAAGWFLAAAQEAGMIATGIEPDQDVAARARAKGLQVRDGYFPNPALAAGQFDLVAFNDVFEHLPDSARCLAEAHRVLAEDGHLILTVPTSRGIFYRTARLFARVGYIPILERLWQKGYESPHLFYYNAANLRSLVERHGFTLAIERPFTSLSIPGLWSRLREGGAFHPALAAVFYLILIAAYPLIRFALPADIVLQIYAKAR